MEAQSPRSRIGGSWTGQFLSSRRGAMTVAALAAILAGALLFAFVQNYRKPPVVAAVPNDFVFMATSYIAPGTPAQTVIADNLLKRVEVPASRVQAGAIGDPAVITGEVSTNAIAANSQITVADFSKANIGIGAYLSGDQRALAVSLDATHGLTAYLAEGDTVDIMSNNGKSSTMIAQNVTVLANAGGDIVVRVTDAQALQLSAFSATTQLWMILRPATGATQSVKIGSVGTAS